MTLHTHKSKLAALLLLIALLAAAVLYAKKDNTINNDTSPNFETAQTPANEKELRKADYLISKHSLGSLIQTTNITLSYNEDGSASALTPNNDTGKKIKKRLNLILYAQDGTTMPLGGRIKSIEQQDSNLKIEITLPINAKTEFLSKNADIITLESRVSQRFPLTALQRDKNGNPYVWTAKETEKTGEFTANKTWVEHFLIGESNFSSGSVIEFDDKIILEPDNKIKNGETYKMAEVKYEAPLKNPIKQAYYNYIKYERDIAIAGLKKDAEECASGATSKKSNIASSPQIAASCGSQPNTKLEPIDIFNAILKRQPGNNSTSGSCGSCNAPPAK